MRTVSNNYKEIIKEPRIINSKVTFDNTIITEDDLNDIQYSFNADLFKTICQEIDIDSNVKIDEGTEINYQFGLYIENDEDYEWVDYGNFKVYTVEELKDVNAYKMICYDRMAESMVPYDKEVEAEQTDLTGMTIRQAFVTLFNDLGWSTAVIPASFTNSTQVITSDPYIGMQYTYRDILDELCTIACVWLGDVNGVIQFMTPNATGETLDEEICSEDNVEIGDKVWFNSVVFSRAVGTDNIYRKDDISIENYGLHEYNLSNYLILESNDRSDYIDGVWNYIQNFEYYALNIKTIGVTYLERLDTFNFEINGISYPTILLNDETNVSSGLQETIYNEKPRETQTNYKYASTTDKANRTAQIIVDKQNAQIQLEVSQKLDEDDFTSANIILAINDGQSSAEINADKISLTGKEIDLTTDNIIITSDNFNVDSEGNMTCRDGTFIGGNITLQDDGSEENASMKIQTIATAQESYALGDDLSSEWIKMIANKEDTFPEPSTLANVFNPVTGSRYSTLIESADYKLILTGLRTTPDMSGDYEKLYSIQLRDSNFDIVDTSLWATTQYFDSTDTMTNASERRNFEEYQLPDDFGNITAINPDNVVVTPAQLNRYFILIDYVSHEFIYSGYGITSDIFLDQTYSASDLTRIDNIIDGQIIPTDSDYEKYDLNGDGVIDYLDRQYIWLLSTGYTYDDSDITRVYNIIMGTITPTQADYDKYDINGTGTITSADLSQINKMIKFIQPIIENTTIFEINTKRLENNISFSQNGEIKTSMDVNGFHQDGYNLYDELFYQPGEQIYFDNLVVGGMITTGTREIVFSVFTEKNLANINTIDVGTGTAMFGRTVNGGYLNNASGGISYGASGYTWTATKKSNNCIQISVARSSNYTNVSNNQPVAIQMYPLYLDLS